MSVKEYLEQAYRIDNRINSKLELIASLHDLAAKTGAALTDMPGSPGRNIHKTEDTIVKILDLENEVRADLNALVDLKTGIMRLISRLENREYQLILEQRYLCFRKWEQISVDLGYSMQHVFRLHGEALRDLERFYES